MRKPNLFVIGAPRCGTTSLYYYLKDHPDIFMSPRKEPPFFNRDIRLEQSRFLSEPEYLSLFEEATTQKYVGEAHVWNLYSSEAAARIKALSPNAKIIAMLRNPIEQLVSMYQYNRAGLFEDQETIEAALALESKRIAGENIPKDCYLDNRLFYTHTAKYALQLKRYLDLFGDGSVHVVWFHELKDAPHHALNSLMEFLGLVVSEQPTRTPANPSYRNRSIAFKRLLNSSALQSIGSATLPIPALRNFIYKFFRRLNYQKTNTPIELGAETEFELLRIFQADIEKLSLMLEKDLSSWLTLKHPKNHTPQ